MKKTKTKKTTTKNKALRHLKCKSQKLNYTEFPEHFLLAWPRGYKTSFMLDSAEHENCPANKSQITNNCKFFLAKCG